MWNSKRAAKKAPKSGLPWGKLPLLIGVVSILSLGSLAFWSLVSSQVSSPALVAADPMPEGRSGNWDLIFSDEFSGSSLDTSKWEPGWFGSGITQPVQSGELQCYDSRQVTVSGGQLHLAAVERPTTCGGVNRRYVSGMVSSRGKFEYTHGYIEARIWMPGSSQNNTANWPAWWSNGHNWPGTGEIDVMEGLSGRAAWHYHWSGGANGGNVSGTWHEGWHTYAAHWEPGRIRWYFDGVLVGTHTTGVVNSPHYLILNYAVGSWGGPVVIPATMRVDHVRVWKPGTASSPPAPTPTPAPAPTPTPPPNPAPPPAPITGNLITNPGCETGTTGWAAWNGSLSRNSSVARSGSASCQAAHTTGTLYTLDDNPDTVLSPRQGQQYTATAYVRSSTAAGKPVNLVLREKGGASPQGYVESPTVFLSNNWQRMTVSTTIAAADRTSLDVYIVQHDATSGNSFQAADISLVLVPSPNLLHNGSFEDGISSWGIKVTSPASATVARYTSDRSDGAASARVRIRRTSSDQWHVQFRQDNVSLVGGRTYTLSFWAKASTGRQIQYVLQQVDSPHQVYVGQSANLTTSWRQYTTSYTPSTNHSNVFLGFNLGQTAGDVLIDNVVLRAD
jgi:beta-glucanase (GH16 family)